MTIKSASNKQACTEINIELSYKDLPLSCPPRDKRLWDAHPRVYMPIEETGKETCPYCGAVYVLKGFKPHQHNETRISDKNINKNN